MITIRPRREADLPELGRLLLEQQPVSGYPHHTPLTITGEDFVRRPGQHAAWVAEEDGRLLGHVAISVPADPATLPEGDAGLVRAWMDAHGRPHERLGEVVLLFVSLAAAGTGVGRRLLATAVDAMDEGGLAPCLDVHAHGESALRLYRRSGWREVGSARPSWLEPESPDVVVMVLPRGGPAGRLSA